MTRAADAATAVPSAGTNYPLTVLAQFARNNDAGTTQGVLNINTNNSTNNEAWLYVDASDRAAALWRASGSISAALNISGVLALNEMHKIAMRCELDNVNMARNGTLATTDTTAPVPSTPNSIVFGVRADSTSPLFGYVQNAAILSGAKTDPELQALTT